MKIIDSDVKHHNRNTETSEITTSMIISLIVYSTDTFSEHYCQT